MKKKKLRSVFSQMKYILLAQQVEAGSCWSSIQGKENHVIKVAVAVLHCEWSSDSLLKLIFS